MKQCTKCSGLYPPTKEYFHGDIQKKDKLSSACKACLTRAKRIQWENKKEQYNATRRTPEYKAKINRQRRAEVNKKYNSTEKAKIAQRQLRERKRDARNLASVKYNSILKNKLRKSIRGGLKKVLANTKTNYNTKLSLPRVNQAVNYTIEQLKLKLEMQFKPGMSWKNYGYYGWHIDHKKPLVRFDLEDDAQLKAACSLANLQPLWAKDNLSKSDKFNI